MTNRDALIAAVSKRLNDVSGRPGWPLTKDYAQEAVDTVLALAAPRHAGDGGVRSDDLVAYLERQWTWSKETFGPALRTKGIVQHITKELREIEADPHDLSEWVDVIILAMDGFWRHGGKPADLLPRMQAKQDKNFARQWPDWRKMGEDQAIEHDRSGEAAATAIEAGTAETAGEGDALAAWQRLSDEASPGTWGVYVEPVVDREEAEAEAILQVQQTKDFSGFMVMLNADGLCPAMTGCGSRSHANAEFIAALVNGWRSGAIGLIPAAPVIEARRADPEGGGSREHGDRDSGQAPETPSPVTGERSGDPHEPCDCAIGDCVRLTRACREDAR